MDVISTARVPAHERFDFWREVSSQLWVPYDLRCEPEAENRFQAHVGVRDFGGFQASMLTTMPHLVQRTDKLIRRTDPEVFKVACLVQGSATVTQGDQCAELRAGDLTLFDTSHPFRGRHTTDRTASRLLLLQFPHALLPLPAREVRRMSCVRLRGDRGTGALLSAFLRQLGTRMDEFGQAECARLATLTMEVLATALAAALDVDGAVPAGTRRRALVARIHAFIRDNLGDPELTPDTIAAAHRISLRYLHKLFQGEGHTVAAWIRECRLQQCRRDLADPQLSGQPVNAIAARWGFPNPAHFSHAFRAAYDVSPRRFRLECTPASEPCTPR
jgi:AraC-like DNA-binding protein